MRILRRLPRSEGGFRIEGYGKKGLILAGRKGTDRDNLIGRLIVYSAIIPDAVEMA